MDLWAVYANYGLPTVTLKEFLNFKGTINLNLLSLDTLDILGSSVSNMKDRLIFIAISSIMRPKKIFEIGTFRGDSAANFALNTDSNARIFTLDLPPKGNELGYRHEYMAHTNPSDKKIIFESQNIRQFSYSNIEEGNKVIQFYGNSFSFDFSDFYDRIDLVFIDAAHNYAAVANDTEKALKLGKEGGLIMWNDYGRWGINEVSEFLHDFRKAGYDVKRIEGSHVAVLWVVSKYKDQ